MTTSAYGCDRRPAPTGVTVSDEWRGVSAQDADPPTGYFGHFVAPRCYSAGTGDGGVSIEAVAEAGDILAEEVGVLLERLTDKVLGSPGAGSIPGVVRRSGRPSTRQTDIACRVSGCW